MSIEINEVIEMDVEKKEVEIEEDDVRELKEVMETLRDTVPAIIQGIVEALYSAQNAQEFGKQVADFYKSMKEAGMSDEQAFELTKQFMDSRDIVGVLKKIFSEGDWKRWSHVNKEDTKKKIKEIVEESMNEVEKEED